MGRIKKDELERDRDLLWSEALALNETGESIMLPEAIWAEATMQQSARTIGEPWVETVTGATDMARAYANGKLWVSDGETIRLGTVYEQTIGTEGEPVERIASAFILSKVIGIPEAQQTAEHGKRMGFAMRTHLWDGSKALRIGGRTVKGFERKLADAPKPGDPANDDRMAEAAHDFAEPPESFSAAMGIGPRGPPENATEMWNQFPVSPLRDLTYWGGGSDGFARGDLSG